MGASRCRQIGCVQRSPEQVWKTRLHGVLGKGIRVRSAERWRGVETRVGKHGGEKWEEGNGRGQRKTRPLSERTGGLIEPVRCVERDAY